MANTKNRFASAKTLTNLNELWEIYTSPENLFCDGELTREQAQWRYESLKQHLREREAELREELTSVTFVESANQSKPSSRF